MKYSTLFTILACFFCIFPWVGLPFGFIRLFISALALVMLFLSIGLYQREQKITLFLRSTQKNDLSPESAYEHVTEKEQVIISTSPLQKAEVKRKRLSDML